MPQDVLTLNLLCRELRNSLLGKKILKVHQPETDELALSVKTQQGITLLVLSANPTMPRVHLSYVKKENPITAMPFCMLARKHLQGGTFTAIELENFDRIIKFTVNSKNELNDNLDFYIYAELMGRYSNIILTHNDNRIIDSIKRISFEQNATRFILPNLTYTAPKQTKTLLNDETKIRELFQENEQPTADDVMSSLSGLSKESTKELLARSTGDFCDYLHNILFNDDFAAYKPCIRYENDTAKDYYAFPYSTLSGCYKFFPSLNEALDVYYKIYDGELRKKTHTKELLTKLKRLQTRIKHRTEEYTDKLKECEKADGYRQYGEFILNNLYKISKGDAYLECDNYYTGLTEKIPLDILLYPNQNAALYFKKYNKLKKAKEISALQLEELKRQSEYLAEIEVSVANASTQNEYDEIAIELNSLGNMKKPPKQQKKQKQKPTKPIHTIIDGFDVYIGRNNQQNVQVTFDIGNGGDMWLHTKAYHGSHVLIRGTNVPVETVEKAAEICAYYSGGRNLPKVEVDYTLRKFVKKISSAEPGRVTYTNYKTMYVEPKVPNWEL